MLCINCGAIPENLVESVLFGHERGSFTGADRRVHGVFEEADGGSLLLDEIGELSTHSQIALLRVLDTNRITRVGSSREIVVDVRVLAATNRDLKQSCDQGTFRSDLFFRLNTMVLRIPPLRQRREEILELARHFVSLGSERSMTFDPLALQVLEQYDWPGNVRELRNAVARAMALAQDNVITVEDLPERMQGHCLPREKEKDAGKIEMMVTTEVPYITKQDLSPTRADEVDLGSRIQHLEKSLIIEAMMKAAGNQTRAAQILGISRRTLINKLYRYRIDKHLGDDKPRSGPALSGSGVDPELESLTLRDRIQRFQIELIQEALDRAGGDLSLAAQDLGIPQYALSKKMKTFGLR